VDGNFVYTPFETAQQLTGMTSGVARASAIYIKFTDNTPIAAGLEKVNSIWKNFKTAHADSQSAELLENVDIQSWRTYRREVIAPIEHEKMLMIAVFAMIAVITVFIVLVVFYMIVAHKIKDIGILKSLGAVGSGIMQLYLIFAAMVGLSGSAVGATLAVLFLNYINPIEQWLYENFEFQLWNRRVYAIGDIPNKIETSTVAVIIVSAIIVCLVGALIPCIKAARQQPVNTLQVTQI
jgi:ABC-type lipoprotein release transport system permease subunit